MLHVCLPVVNVGVTAPIHPKLIIHAQRLRLCAQGGNQILPTAQNTIPLLQNKDPELLVVRVGELPFGEHVIVLYNGMVGFSPDADYSFTRLLAPIVKKSGGAKGLGQPYPHTTSPTL